MIETVARSSSFTPYMPCSSMKNASLRMVLLCRFGKLMKRLPCQELRNMRVKKGVKHEMCRWGGQVEEVCGGIQPEVEREQCRTKPENKTSENKSRSVRTPLL